MNFYKRLVAVLAVGALSIGAFAFGASAYGTDNNTPYSFTVPANQEIGYGSAEYRGNSGIEVPWKIDFTFSAEGKGTSTYYYLSGPWWSHQSNAKLATQGKGAKYYHAHDTAKNMDVALAAYNNNKNDKVYMVAGYWDEETAKHTFSD